MTKRAYDEGELAGKLGKEMTENPYASPKSSKNDFHQWFAGWVYGVQLRKEKQKQEDQEFIKEIGAA